MEKERWPIRCVQAVQDVTDTFSCPKPVLCRTTPQALQYQHDTVLEVIRSSITPLLSDTDCLIAERGDYTIFFRKFDIFFVPVITFFLFLLCK